MMCAGNWRNVDLASCPRLESIWIYVCFRAPPDERQPTGGPALCLAGAGMLTRAPSTLRNIAIYLDDLPQVSALGDRRLLRLQAFDEVITPERFPLLEGVDLRIALHWHLETWSTYDWEDVEAAAQEVLPLLHSRGVLKVVEF